MSRHPEKRLTAIAVRNAKPGRHADGNGLYLVVDETGAKRWMQRIVVHGRRRDIGLGSARLITLAAAREMAEQNRRVARSGGDPIAERRRARQDIPTFEQAVRDCHKEQAPTWRNPKHAAQWLSTLETYAFPKIGSTRIDQIGTPEIIACLGPIWIAKPETARRVRQRIGTVMDWASGRGFRDGENPARAVTRGLPKQTGKQEHFGALPYIQVPAFIRDLRASSAEEMTKLAFELLILTACRTGEIIGAHRGEVDFNAGTWTIPAERMKAGKPHVVPMTPRATEILTRAGEIHSGHSDFLFEGWKRGAGLSNGAFLRIMTRLNYEATPHGFRSSFRDWAAEATNFPREVAEACLAHVLENKVEAAYRRSDLLEKRRALLEVWERYVTTEPAGKVVAMARRETAGN